MLFSISVDVLPILAGIFPLTFDQGRDFIWVQNQLLKSQPSLVGPWGSISGTFFGPLWFWLLALPSWLSAGNPVVLTLFNTLVIYLTLALVTGIIYHRHKRLGVLVLILGLLSPGLHGIANFAFSQHLLPILTLGLIYSSAQLLHKPQPIWLYGAALAVALMFHAEPPLTILSLPFLIGTCYWSQRRFRWLSLKTMIVAGFLFSVPFWPLILFDWRHDFIQSKGFIAYFAGDHSGFKPIAQTSLLTHLVDRPIKLLIVFQQSLIGLSRWLFLPIGSVIIYFNQRFLSGFWRKLWQASAGYVISLWLVLTIFPEELKLFYLNGLFLVFILWAALALNTLIAKRQLSSKKLYLLLVLLFFINLKPLSFFRSLSLGFTDRHKLESLYVNQVSAIDWIYVNATGQGFKVYIFTPPIYDFAWQYLFLNYGLSTYGYLPEEFAYLPQVPSYVPMKGERLKAPNAEIRLAEQLLYLVVTDSYPNRINGWRANFASLELELAAQHQLPDKTKIEQYLIK
jgi:hypothetical protein